MSFVRFAGFAASLLAAGLCASPAAQAKLYGVKTIELANGNGMWLQVGELVATRFGDGADVALASAGAAASAPNQYSATSGAALAIDGIYPAAYSGSATPGIFHSLVIGSTAMLDVTLAKATTLSSLTIYGRTDCCAFRDIYNITLRNALGDVIWTGTLDASAANGLGATIELNPLAPVSTPEAPTTALMLAGFGGLALLANRRGRKGAALAG